MSEKNLLLEAKEPYVFIEDSNGILTATDFYGSVDDKAGRELVVWIPETRTIRFFISYPNNYDLINALMVPRQCVITYGYYHAGTPPGQWTEFVCDVGEERWLGWHMVPERNWQGTFKIEELQGKEVTIEWYSLGINLNDQGRARRGKHRFCLRKLWECPARIAAQLEVPHVACMEGFPSSSLFAKVYAASLGQGL